MAEKPPVDSTREMRKLGVFARQGRLAARRLPASFWFSERPEGGGEILVFSTAWLIASKRRPFFHFPENIARAKVHFWRIWNMREIAGDEKTSSLLFLNFFRWLRNFQHRRFVDHWAPRAASRRSPDEDPGGDDDQAHAEPLAQARRLAEHLERHHLRHRHLDQRERLHPRRLAQ